MAVIKHIEVPEEWESTNDWDSHRPLLYLALKNKGGDVIEMGSGLGSTLLLDKECYNSDRRFLTVENNDEYVTYNVFGHIIFDEYLTLEEEWPEVINNLDVGILFIDCAPGEIRKDLIEKWTGKAEVIIVHDSEIGAEYVYGLSSILSTFKYRLDYQPEGKPATTAVSNFVNVSEWI